jgi:hypothetical protein
LLAKKISIEKKIILDFGVNKSALDSTNVQKMNVDKIDKHRELKKCKVNLLDSNMKEFIQMKKSDITFSSTVSQVSSELYISIAKGDKKASVQHKKLPK